MSRPSSICRSIAINCTESRSYTGLDSGWSPKVKKSPETQRIDCKDTAAAPSAVDPRSSRLRSRHEMVRIASRPSLFNISATINEEAPIRAEALSATRMVSTLSFQESARARRDEKSTPRGGITRATT